MPILNKYSSKVTFYSSKKKKKKKKKSYNNNYKHRNWTVVNIDTNNKCFFSTK